MEPITQRCGQCDSPAIEMTDSSGNVVDGPFRERYHCNDCGALGLIRGEAGAPPDEWKKTGTLFNGGVA